MLVPLYSDDLSSGGGTLFLLLDLQHALIIIMTMKVNSTSGKATIIIFHQETFISYSSASSFTSIYTSPSRPQNFSRLSV